MTWGTCLSYSFTATKETKGAARPYPFGVYLDLISVRLGTARKDAFWGNMVVNHQLFADDLNAFDLNFSCLERVQKIMLLNMNLFYSNSNKTVVVRQPFFSLPHQLFPSMA